MSSLWKHTWYTPHPEGYFRLIVLEREGKGSNQTVNQGLFPVEAFHNARRSRLEGTFQGHQVQPLCSKQEQLLTKSGHSGLHQV